MLDEESCEQMSVVAVDADGEMERRHTVMLAEQAIRVGAPRKQRVDLSVYFSFELEHSNVNLIRNSIF